MRTGSGVEDWQQRLSWGGSDTANGSDTGTGSGVEAGVAAMIGLAAASVVAQRQGLAVASEWEW